MAPVRLNNQLSQNQSNYYTCTCGCKLEFDTSNLGVEYIIDYTNEAGYGCSIIEDRIVGNSWNHYIYDFDGKTFGDFKDIINQYRNTDIVWIHLYNTYFHKNIPANALLTLEYCY